MVDRLVAAGLVDRAPSLDHRRVKLVSLTGRVWAVLASFCRPAGERVLDVVARHGPDGSDELAVQMTAQPPTLSGLTYET